MAHQKSKSNLPSPAHIGEQVRTLRTTRRWTQAELAAHLNLSQSRLSELERGQGSFTAEQFLEILRLFSVGVDTFAPSPAPSEGLQNALARFGARHLRETSALPDPAYSTPAAVLTAVLLQPASERHVTALAPVLVWSIDDLSLPLLQSELSRSGRAERLPWLVENTVRALSSELPLPREWLLRRKRAEFICFDFMYRLTAPEEGWDPFDMGLRSDKSAEQVREQASWISKRWRILSRLQISDFAQALREAAHER